MAIGNCAWRWEIVCRDRRLYVHLFKSSKYDISGIPGNTVVKVPVAADAAAATGALYLFRLFLR